MPLQLDARFERHAQVAQALVREKQPAKALLILKKKKLVEKQMEQLGALQLNIDAMVGLRSCIGLSIMGSRTVLVWTFNVC